MPSVRRNAIANLFGGGWAAVMGLAFVPLYIKYMGVEAYGLVGVFISLQAIFAVLDMGLSQTLAREMARLSVSSGANRQMADTARTLEVIYWLFALLVGGGLAFGAHFIANYWLKPDQLSTESVRHALWIMALVIVLRWPLTLYIGGMNGLQRQVLLNGLLAFFATFQGIGAVLVLSLLEPTVEAFFTWQAFSSLLQVLVIRYGFWHALPVSGGRFSLRVLDGIWRFALGMTGISLLATILTQLDKLVLSKMLSLENFGFYVFASTVASVLFRAVSPIFTSYLPRFTQLVSSGDIEALKANYRQAGQAMAMALIPVACLLAVYSDEILMLWTQNKELVENTRILVGILVVGNMLNGLVNIPYALQVAYGWIRFGLVQNAIAVVLVVPALLFFIGKFDQIGAAVVWAGLNFLFLVVGVFIMHRTILIGEWTGWLLQSVVYPLLAGGVAVLTAKALLPVPHGLTQEVLLLFGVSLLVFCAVAISLPFCRQFVSRSFVRLA